MASFYKKLAAVVVGLTLAMLIASNGEETSSFGGSALCDSSTGVTCTSDAGCVTICKKKAGQNYVYGYCSGGGRSCMCAERCGAQSTLPPLEKKPAPAAPAWRGMGMLK
ncbi:unnamed protein product [Miscanthus lutarioriparius]|uniref:Knottin scorpion toxin-like domain-containing protein n=1 Tax=Miscanthus lutarioriparius TaxID=422564 RepID=A0A811Q3K0_9POAL|nr:unnamed protein product [Miscanthus lutarioriparius]